MIHNRQKFDFHHQTLIEKVTIRPPFRYEAIFQDEGCFLYVCGARTHFNAPTEKIHINAGEAVLLKCGSYFVDWLKNAHASTVEVYAVHLYPGILKNIYKNELPSFITKRKAGPYIQRIVPENTIAKFIESLNFYFENPALVNEELLALKIKELILLLIQTRNAASVLELVSELFTPREVALKEVIHTHLYSNLSVSEMAQLCNLSTSSFKREFKEIFNDSPIRYINAKRLEKAKELLRVSDRAVNDIAYELGFNDPAYFSRIFKKRFGVPPSSLHQVKN
jgi:AraC family transcriptional regulator, exoenzyme S synthesis regulatory protein ExsA